ncbi:MAG: acetyl-CoA carboxylase biotin carboxyl carrier protein subunit [Bacteroidia bacterium]|nr:acetyl-CoA carboxylase biotin carboxyl carrier protein subunit [Bacteroidia bacterium]
MKKNYTISIANGGNYETSFNDELLVAGEAVQINPISIENGEYQIILNGKTIKAELIATNLQEKKFTLLINGNKYMVQAADEFDLLLKKMGFDSANSQKIKEMKAPMPGMVLSIVVNEGDVVNKGDTLLVLEAMKMENSIKSPGEGKIKQILAQKGKPVEKNQVLIVFE